MALVGMMPAILLLVARLTTRTDPAAPQGIYRLSGVPGSLAVLLWALLHLVNLGEARQVVVFSGMALIAAAALIKNLRHATPAWREVGLLSGLGIGPGGAMARGPLVAAGARPVRLSHPARPAPGGDRP